MLDRKAFEEEMREARQQELWGAEYCLNRYTEEIESLREIAPYAKISEEAIRYLEEIPISTEGKPFRQVLEELQDYVFSAAVGLSHPRCFAFVTSAVSPYSVAGAIMSDMYNLHAGGYQLSPGANIIEEKLIRWMGSLAGYPGSCGGLFTSGGSMSNLTGMIAARANVLTEEEYQIAVAYTSDQAHSSVRKGMKLMGLRQDQIRIIPSDEDFRMDPVLLEKAIREDLKAGRKPFLIVASMGTTNTGSIDPLPELGRIREKYGMWLHVDGAFGGSILLSEIYRNLAKGLELSDSFSWDLHKWALQCYSCSACIARDKKQLVRTYAEHPEYLGDIIDSEHIDGWDLGIEMSRPTRAIRFWFTVQAMGTDKLADVIDYAFYNSHVAERQLKSFGDWEICAKPMCGTLNFRYAPKDVDSAKYDALNSEISRQIIESDFAYVVTTVLKGKRVLRMCMINGNTTTDDVTDTLDKLNEIARKLKASFM